MRRTGRQVEVCVVGERDRGGLGRGGLVFDQELVANDRVGQHGREVSREEALLLFVLEDHLTRRAADSLPDRLVVARRPAMQVGVPLDPAAPAVATPALFRRPAPELRLAAVRLLDDRDALSVVAAGRPADR